MVSSRFALLLALAASCVAGAIVSAERSPEAMVAAGQQFVEALTPAERQQAVFTIDSAERLKWNYVPDERFPRQGLALTAMTAAQRMRAEALLRAGLSQKGYATFTAIMQADAAPLSYRFSIFGSPSPDSIWGWRVDGDLVSLHFTVVKGHLVSSTPTFAGANRPRLLAEQDDTARAFLMALTPEQQQAAIFTAEAPEDIVTGHTDKVDPMKPVGLQAAKMEPGQRLKLMDVVKSYSSLMADDLAAERIGRIWSAGIENVYFAWAGGTQPGQKHYYRIQGPTFLIEFDTQGDANSIHSVWRDYNGDFGRDLLREHLKEEPHATASASSSTAAH